MITVKPAQEDRLRPYINAVMLLLLVDGLMVFGDRFLVKFGFPWSLVSLLVIAAVANLWGDKPALFVLALSALFGGFVVPELHIVSYYGQAITWRTGLMRTLMFMACGATVIWLAHQSRVMRESAERRRAVVQALQAMVLPDNIAVLPHCDAAAVYRPARQEEEVGGDFYDVFHLNHESTQYGIFMGDVVGKGKEAAVFTALLRYSCRAYAALGYGPAEILQALNLLIDDQNIALGTASMFVGILNDDDGILRYANAGHEPPLLARADGGEEELTATGPLIGVLASVKYEEMSVCLEKDDGLLLVTDGVTEARDRQGRFLEEEGTWRLLRPLLTAKTAEEIVMRFHQDLEAFMAGRQRDDIAILFLRRCVSKTSYAVLSSTKGALPSAVLS